MHLRGVLIAIGTRENLFHLELRTRLKVLEHALLTSLELEGEHAIRELVTTDLAVKVGVDRLVRVEDGNLEREFLVSIFITDFAFDLLLYDQALERPVLDLHRVAVEVVDSLTVIDLVHVISQLDDVIDINRGVSVRCLNLLNVVDVGRTRFRIIKPEGVTAFCYITVEYDFALLVCLENELLCIVRIRAKVDVFVLAIDLELCALELLGGIVSVDLDDLEADETSLA